MRCDLFALTTKRFPPSIHITLYSCSKYEIKAINGLEMFHIMRDRDWFSRTSGPGV